MGRWVDEPINIDCSAHATHWPRLNQLKYTHTFDESISISRTDESTWRYMRNVWRPLTDAIMIATRIPLPPLRARAGASNRIGDGDDDDDALMGMRQCAMCRAVLPRRTVHERLSMGAAVNNTCDINPPRSRSHALACANMFINAYRRRMGERATGRTWPFGHSISNAMQAGRKKANANCYFTPGAGRPAAGNFVRIAHTCAQSIVCEWQTLHNVRHSQPIRTGRPLGRLCSRSIGKLKSEFPRNPLQTTSATLSHTAHKGTPTIASRSRQLSVSNLPSTNPAKFGVITKSQAHIRAPTTVSSHVGRPIYPAATHRTPPEPDGALLTASN